MSAWNAWGSGSVKSLGLREPGDERLPVALADHLKRQVAGRSAHRPAADDAGALDR